MANVSNLRLLKSYPLCIICAKPSEAQTIAREMGATRRIHAIDIEEIHNGHTFYLGEMPIFGQGKPLEYYITSSLRQGVMNFATHAGILFSILRPRFAIHAGVCAGYDGSDGGSAIKIGDVIFGETAITHGEGKWETLPDGETVFKPEYQVITKNCADLQGFSHNRGGINYGSYITVAAVREDVRGIFKEIRAHVNRNAIALDMEAAAFLQLCDYSDVIPLGVIKGVSDHGNSSKREITNNYTKALKNTGIELKDWIEYVMEKLTWQRDEANEKGAIISKGYYENFIRRIVDSITLGLPVTPMNIYDPPITQAPIGLRLVIPHDNDISYIEDQTHIDRIARRHELQEVLVGGGGFRRTVYYKDDYLYDFMRCLNSLTDTPDPVYQVEIFVKFIRAMPFLKGKEPFAEVLKWEDFEKDVPARSRSRSQSRSHTPEPSSVARSPELEPKILLEVPFREKPRG